jgi:hypothetical protein
VPTRNNARPVQPAPRTADPYRDTDVIDERAPRTNQTVVFVVALAGAVFGWPLAWALMALQLLVGLTFGRRFCLPCLAYFELIQPRIGEGRLEDSRPPRLANQMGFAFLTAAAVSWWLGAETLGTVLGGIVAALARLAATTGFCTGCELYKLSARFRGISARHHDRIEVGDLDGFPAADRNIVQFTHPICSDCREWDARLAAEGTPRVTIDVRESPGLAEKYGIAVVPTIFAVDREGAVIERLA